MYRKLNVPHKNKIKMAPRILKEIFEFLLRKSAKEYCISYNLPDASTYSTPKVHI
jgi:hypothetical protein